MRYPAAMLVACLAHANQHHLPCWILAKREAENYLPRSLLSARPNVGADHRRRVEAWNRLTDDQKNFFDMKDGLPEILSAEEEKLFDRMSATDRATLSTGFGPKRGRVLGSLARARQGGTGHSRTGRPRAWHRHDSARGIDMADDKRSRNRRRPPRSYFSAGSSSASWAEESACRGFNVLSCGSRPICSRCSIAFCADFRSVPFWSGIRKRTSSPPSASGRSGSVRLPAEWSAT